jgi:hypothetical protein
MGRVETPLLVVVVQALQCEHVCLRNRHSVTAAVYLFFRRRCLAAEVIYNHYLATDLHATILILYKTFMEVILFEISCPTQAIVTSDQWDETQWFRISVHNHAVRRGLILSCDRRITTCGILKQFCLLGYNAV